MALQLQPSIHYYAIFQTSRQWRGSVLSSQCSSAMTGKACILSLKVYVDFDFDLDVEDEVEGFLNHLLLRVCYFYGHGILF